MPIEELRHELADDVIQDVPVAGGAEAIETGGGREEEGRKRGSFWTLRR